jgi:linearmycin/streptolysin S transport system permease protein
MRIIFTLVRKDLANFRRNRSALVLTFIVPIALIYIFGAVFGLNRTDSGPSGIALGVVNESDNPAAQKLVAALQAESAFDVRSVYRNPDKTTRPLTEADARAMIHNRDFDFAVVIPKDVVRDGAIGLHLKILSDPRNDIEAQMVNGLLQKTIFSHVPELLGQSLQARAKGLLGGAKLDRFNTTLADSIGANFGGDPAKIKERIASGDFFSTATDAPTASGPTTAATPGASPDNKKAINDFLARIVKIDNEQVTGKDVKSPAATRVIGGMAMMFLLFALSNGAAAFFDEKNAGIFQRLLAAPVSRGQLLWSRFVYGILLGLVQLMTMFVAGNLLFGVDIYHHLPGLFVVCAAAAAACTAFAMFVAAFSPNAQAASGLATFLVMMMSSTGGAWFPRFLMPPFMQTIGKFTLVYWSMEGFSQVLWAGSTFFEVMRYVGVLLAIAGGVMALSIWRLNRRKIFE